MSTEIEIMKRIRHRHIVSMYELYETPKCLWIILELVNRCVLRGMENRGSRCGVDIRLNVPALHGRCISSYLIHACRSLYGEPFEIAKSTPHNGRREHAPLLDNHMQCVMLLSLFSDEHPPFLFEAAMPCHAMPPTVTVTSPVLSLPPSLLSSWHQ